jgi:hypothetical protein
MLLELRAISARQRIQRIQGEIIGELFVLCHQSSLRCGDSLGCPRSAAPLLTQA